MEMKKELLYKIGYCYAKCRIALGEKDKCPEQDISQPVLGLVKLVDRLHSSHKITDELDRLISNVYSDITDSNSVTEILPTVYRYSWHSGYLSGLTKK